MSDRYKPNPIEEVASVAAEQEAATLDSIGQQFRRTTPIGKKRLTEREMVARWLIATPEQRSRARAQWGEEKFAAWNTKMFQLVRKNRGV